MHSRFRWLRPGEGVRCEIQGGNCAFVFSDVPFWPRFSRQLSRPATHVRSQCQWGGVVKCTVQLTHAQRTATTWHKRASLAVLFRARLHPNVHDASCGNQPVATLIFPATNEYGLLSSDEGKKDKIVSVASQGGLQIAKKTRKRRGCLFLVKSDVNAWRQFRRCCGRVCDSRVAIQFPRTCEIAARDSEPTVLYL